MSDSAAESSNLASAIAWKILVVDDEPTIHQITKLSLRNLSVLNYPCLLINVLSTKDAREQFKRNPDIALVLLDAEMENEEASLQLLHHIRHDIGNHWTRIILRTDKPGQAPPRSMIIDYDISDYKEKTELTANNLFTTVATNIRTFNHLRNAQNQQRAAQVLGQLTPALFGSQDERTLAMLIVKQLDALGHFKTITCWLDSYLNAPIASTTFAPVLEPQRSLLAQAQKTPSELQTQDLVQAVTFPLSTGKTLLVCMTTVAALDAANLQLLGLWVGSVRSALARWTKAS